MILLNTKFAVSDDLTRQMLFSLLTDWLHDSHFCDDTIRESIRDFKWDMETFTVQTKDGSIQVLLDNYEDSFCIQVINHDDDAIYKTNYVLKDKKDVPILQCVQDKAVTALSVQDYRKVRLPKLLRAVFWNELCGDDHGLSIDDKPFILRKNDIEIAKQIVSQEVEYDMPVIYVSSDDMNRYAVNYEVLASEMVGQAHVVLEGSPVISNKVRELVGESKPHSGAIRVYLPNRQSKLYLPINKQADKDTKEQPLHYTIINDVRNMQSSLAISDEFNLEKIRQRHLFSKLSKAGDSELVAIAESMISEKDVEIEALKKELDETKKKLSVSASKAAGLQAQFEEAEDDNDKCLALGITEKPLYDREIEDVILRVLQKEYDGMKDDSNLSNSRKFHVLEDVLEHNFPSGTDIKLVECIKSVVKDGTLSKDGIGRLRDAGFNVEKEGRQAHYHITFGGDERYATSYSATPSDRRGAKNFVSEYTNMLFGY